MASTRTLSASQLSLMSTCSGSSRVESTRVTSAIPMSAGPDLRRQLGERIGDRGVQINDDHDGRAEASRAPGAPDRCAWPTRREISDPSSWASFSGGRSPSAEEWPRRIRCRTERAVAISASSANRRSGAAHRSLSVRRPARAAPRAAPARRSAPVAAHRSDRRSTPSRGPAVRSACRRPCDHVR